ncbi:hypothetical protein Tco_0557959 [Tanacetum coccineum]
MVIEGEVLNDFLRFVGILIAEFAIGGAVNLVLKMKGDMIINILNLKPTIDAMMRDFFGTEVHGMSIRFTPTGGFGSKRYHIVPYGELHGIPVAVVARWDGYENTIHDHEERENEEEHENEERCELFDNPHQETLVCKIRRFEMIKYSFGQDEEYVAIKECEYDDLTITMKMHAGHTKKSFIAWTKGGWTSLEKKLTKLVNYRSSGILCVL